MASKTQSPEHAGATLAQKMRKNRDALTKAKERVTELEAEAKELTAGYSADAIDIAKRILGQ